MIVYILYNIMIMKYYAALHVTYEAYADEGMKPWQEEAIVQAAIVQESAGFRNPFHVQI
jgi:hypothetical protein